MAAPSQSAAATARNLVRPVMRALYRIEVDGAGHLAGPGPLVVVTRCEALLATAVLHAIAPRPTHVVGNAAEAVAVPRRLASLVGDLVASSAAAVDVQQRARAALVEGRIVAVAGSAVSAAYLVATTAAPVVPVAIDGADGAVGIDPPRPRSRIRVRVLAPVTIGVPGDPLRATTRAAVHEQIRQLLADADADAGEAAA